MTFKKKYKLHIVAIIRTVAVVSSIFVLASCGQLPLHEYETFKPLPIGQRIMQQPRVSWEIREDVASYCAQAKGMGQQQAFLTPPLACAIWLISKNECTVVTGRDVSHVALGHELRHCFEGHFH
jgi:hypothetical protein